MEQEKVLRGSCLCGRITYAIHEDVEMVSHCHCPTCRKAHAAAFASAVTVKHEVLELTSSRALLKYFDSSAGKRLYFCPNCGSHIYARINNSDSCLVYVGTLDMELPPCPSRHVFTRHRALWYSSQDMAPEYEEWPEEASVNAPEAAGPNLSAQISTALHAALRRGTMTSLLLLEIDRPMAYNGNSGEENVEDIIVAVTAAITKNIREADTAALYGDCGFAVLLPYTDATAASMMAERIRKIIQGISSLNQGITASIGTSTVASHRLDESTPETEADILIEHAELALRQAGAGGGNQTRHFDKLA